MPKVLVFKETILPASETFILAQMTALRRYDAVLGGLEPAHPSLALPHSPLLLSRHKPWLADVRSKLYRRTGAAPVFHARVKSQRPDLIHAHFASGGRTVLPLARSLGVPLVVTLHGKDVTLRARHPDLYRRLGEEAARFLCVSRFIRDCALAAGFPPEKLEVHSIGIDRRSFAPAPVPQSGHGILFVGRLVEKKGCEYLVRAMQRVQQEHPGSELTVIGDGPLRLPLKELARSLSIRCRFLGSQFAPAVRQELERARVFCVPSVTAADGDSEGLGMVFAEAQAMGVPVISTTHGGVPEIVIDNVTGLLAPERDYAALAGRISLLLGNDALWEKFRDAGILHIERHFDLLAQTAMLEDIYDGVLSGTASSDQAERLSRVS